MRLVLALFSMTCGLWAQTGTDVVLCNGDFTTQVCRVEQPKESLGECCHDHINLPVTAHTAFERWDYRSFVPRKFKLTSWKYSVLALTWASTLDITSSRGLYETNPIIGRGNFGVRQASTKAGIVGGLVLGEYLWLRKHPQHEKALVYFNVGASGVSVGIAIHNFRIGHAAK